MKIYKGFGLNVSNIFFYLNFSEKQDSNYFKYLELFNHIESCIAIQKTININKHTVKFVLPYKTDEFELLIYIPAVPKKNDQLLLTHDQAIQILNDAIINFDEFTRSKFDNKRLKKQLLNIINDIADNIEFWDLISK